MNVSKACYGMAVVFTVILSIQTVLVIVLGDFLSKIDLGSLPTVLPPWGAFEHPELSSNPATIISWMMFLLMNLFLVFAMIMYVLEMLFSKDHVLLNRKVISDSLNDHIINEIKHVTVAVIPAHDEEATISEVVGKALKFVSEVIVVNDGSEDLTAKKARAAGATVIDNPRKMGLCHAMLRGLKAALSRDCQYVVTLDADGQYLPEEIPFLVYPLLQGAAEVVLGSRLKGRIESMPRIKRFGNWAFTKVLRKLSGIPISDGQTGFRAFKKEVLHEIIPMHYIKHTYTQQQVIIMGTKGITVREVPITFLKRHYGPSRLISSPLQYAINGWYVIVVSLIKNAPLRFFGMLGLFLVLLSIPSFLYNMQVFALRGEMLLPEWTMVILGLNSWLGVFLIIIGLILAARSDDGNKILS